MSKKTALDPEKAPGKFFVPSLTLAFFSTYIIELLTGLYLKDIAYDFLGSSDLSYLGTASQLVTISSIAAVLAGLVLGFSSFRFNYKSLLLVGILCVSIGILGCYFAQSFFYMQIFYPIEGIGTIIVGSMCFALIGEFLALNKRAQATSWVVAGGPISVIVASFVAILLIRDVGASWRPYLLWFALPISLIALVFVYLGVPSISYSSPRKIGTEEIIRGFKKVLMKKSAFGCLIGNMLRQAGFAWGGVYAVSFFRDTFFSGQPDKGLEFGTLISLGGAIVFSLAIITGGYLVNRIGRKRLLVTTLVCSSPFLPFMYFVPDLWIALAVNWVGTFIYAMGFPGSVNLTLEQTPEFRGPMMSMSSMFITLGLGLGTFLGGTLLALFENYFIIILAFTILGLAAAAVYFFLTKDPCRT